MDASLERFPHPHLAVDVVLLCLRQGALHALVSRRAEEPHAGAWVLPGGFVRLDETLEAAAARVLREKVGLAGVWVEQLFTFGALERDPRARVVSVAYVALVPEEQLARAVACGRDGQLAAVEVPWSAMSGGPVRLRGARAADPENADLPIGFDHADILGLAIQRLRGKIEYAPVGFELLPREFTLLDLQRVHEAVLGRALNKDSFRRRLLASGQLLATGQREHGVGHRPAELYRFRRAPAAKAASSGSRRQPSVRSNPERAPKRAPKKPR